MDDFLKAFLIAMGVAVSVILSPLIIVFGLDYLMGLFL